MITQEQENELAKGIRQRNKKLTEAQIQYLVDKRLR